MKLLRTLLEGGNVFKTKEGEPLTQRINQADVPATIAWIEQVTGLKFPEERQLGSTGRKPTSGDLDLGVDANEITKDQLAAMLTQFVQSQGQDPREYVKKAGEVHLRTPIAGDPNRGFVQTDFMFFPNLDWGQFYYGGADNTEYKGMNRAVLWSSMAKHHGLKVGSNGVFSRATEKLVSQDPDQFAKWVLGPGFNRNNLKSVESIYTALANNPDADAMIKDFREYLAKQGLKEPQVAVRESDAGFLGRLRDRLINQGMQPILEAEQAGVGGRAKGIEHLEDMVFRFGTSGITQALEIAQHAAESPAGTTTVKWDGMPALIFGRKPTTGEFVLTDGSGFDAKGYDGLATSPRMMADIQNRRSGDRSGLIAMYAKLFPILEAALPQGFRGYVKGDLLYTNTPPQVAGNYVFKPNTVEYKIPARSPLGQRIGNSEIGIAMHTMYADQGEARQPLSRVRFNDVPGLLLVDPSTSVPKSIVLDQNIVKQLKNIARTQGKAIDLLFNPAELRARKITDLAKLCVDYVNTKVGQPINRDTFLPEFGEWLQTKVTPQKFRNIVEYLQSPTSNTPALAAAFTAFILLNDLKEDIRSQLDYQHPGQEGWVMATPAGYAKAVGRFDPQGFAALNRARNNPQGA
jgi:hypothetical protein